VWRDASSSNSEAVGGYGGFDLRGRGAAMTGPRIFVPRSGIRQLAAGRDVGAVAAR
jgi:hypothetical protein